MGSLGKAEILLVLCDYDISRAHSIAEEAASLFHCNMEFLKSLHKRFDKDINKVLEYLSSDPSTLDYLDGIGQNHRAFALCLAFLQLKLAVRHLILRLVAGPGELDALLEGLGLVIHEVDGALAGAQDVLGGVGTIAAGKQHSIVILAGYIVGLHQGVGAQSGAAVLAQGRDYNRGHRKEQGGLVEIIYHA